MKFSFPGDEGIYCTYACTHLLQSCNTGFARLFTSTSLKIPGSSPSNCWYASSGAFNRFTATPTALFKNALPSSFPLFSFSKRTPSPNRLKADCSSFPASSWSALSCSIFATSSFVKRLDRVDERESLKHPLRQKTTDSFYELSEND